MLLQFRVKNVKSFREEAILDFTAAKINEHAEHTFLKNKNTILPLVAIYGANASGKSNLLNAFIEMCEFISTSVEYGGDKKNYSFVLSPFFYSTKTFNNPSEFESIVAMDIDYRYGFSINPDGKVVTEYLEFRKTPKGTFLSIFQREKQEFEFGTSSILSADEVKELKFTSEFIRDTELMLTMLGRRQKSTSTKTSYRYAQLYEWYSACAECPECNNRKRDIMYVKEDTPLYKMFNDDSIDDFVGFVKKADPTITGLALEVEDDKKDPQNDRGARMIMCRYGFDDDKYLNLPTLFESSGTRYILRAYPVINHVLKSGGLLIADEIDRSLHPVLLLDIINLFTNPESNPKHAQLLCTMHNAIIMDKRFLRRDEIWFVEKDEKGESTIYSLADFRVNDATVRNDADFCKNYILGMYGAVPLR